MLIISLKHTLRHNIQIQILYNVIQIQIVNANSDK